MAAIAVMVYVIGLLILYVWGTLNNGWYDYYYLWDKGKDLLLFMALYYTIDGKHKWVVMPVIVFSLIRFIWQIISGLTGWNINDNISVGWLFIMLAFVCSILTLKELIKWRK